MGFPIRSFAAALLLTAGVAVAGGAAVWRMHARVDSLAGREIRMAREVQEVVQEGRRARALSGRRDRDADARSRLVEERLAAGRDGIDAELAAARGALRNWLVAGAALLVLLGACWWRMVKLLRRRERAHEETAAALGQVNRRLEASLADTQDAQRQLIDAARRVGMADMATSVLHNVGNALNSVNVAAGLLIERVRASKTARLHHVVGLLREHKDDLAAFLTSDEKGKKLPEYLAAVAAAADDERAYLRLELDTLKNGVGHITTIVGRQQAAAKGAGGMLEPLVPSEVFEEAVKLETSSLARYEVEVVREHEPLPPLLLDRHRVFQVVVNLITNARQALAEAPGPRRLTLRSGRAGDGQVYLEVADNGPGIRPEHLTSIFAHGFTTKKNGHGFGLHGSACAAADMRGRLTCHSDGLGKGATFRLVVATDAARAS